MFLLSGPLLPNAMSSHCIVEYKGQIIITGGLGLKDQGYTVLLFRLNDTEEIRYVIAQIRKWMGLGTYL
jgi:hypothetical protein